MIKVEDAIIANVAMACTLWPEYHARFTEFEPVKLWWSWVLRHLSHINKLNALWFRQNVAVAWVNGRLLRGVKVIRWYNPWIHHRGDHYKNCHQKLQNHRYCQRSIITVELFTQLLHWKNCEEWCRQVDQNKSQYQGANAISIEKKRVTNEEYDYPKNILPS